MKKFLTVLLCVLFVFATIACEEECKHNFAEGECTLCGEACAHTYASGECSICGQDCVHTYVNGECSVCGTACTHTFAEGECSVCGTPCTHTFVNGECSVCGTPCAHTFAEGECTICGSEDPDYIPADGGASLYAQIITELKALAVEFDANSALPSKEDGVAFYVDALYEVFEEYDADEQTEIGYVVKDINADGWKELFVMGRGLKVYALFTIANKEVKLVTNFTDANSCYYIDNGEFFYTASTRDGANSQISVAYFVKKLSGTELVGFEYGWVDADGDGSNSDDKEYYKKDAGVKTDLTYDEYKVYQNHKYEYHTGNPTRLAKRAKIMFTPAVAPTDEAEKTTADFSTYEKIIATFEKMYTEATSGKFDRTKFLDGVFDNGMKFNSEEDFYIYNAIIDACANLQGSATSSKYGYAYKDLTGDGIDELLLIDQYGSGSSMRHDIFAIFTKDATGKVELFDTYNDLKYAFIDENSNLVVVERELLRHKKAFEFTVYSVVENAFVSNVYGYDCDYATTSTKNYWYKVVDGEEVAIEESAYDELATVSAVVSSPNVANYGKQTAKMAGLTFVQVAVEE